MSPDDGSGATGTPSASPAPAAAAPAPEPAAAPAPAATPAPAGDDKPGYWPTDWRENAAGGDEKLLSELRKYASPAAVAKSMRAAQVKISSGELKPILGKNPTAEDLAAYRKSHGIPEAADKYDLDLGKGFVVSEEDKPLVEDFLKTAWETHQTPDQVKGTLRAYYALEEKISTARAEKDQEQAVETEEALRSEWGTDYLRNKNMILNYLDTVTDPDTAKNLLTGRLADGTPVGSSPEVLKMLIGIAMRENPAGIMIPGGGAGPQGVDDEIAKIEKVMKEDRKSYDKDEKMQARLRDLYDMREVLNSRAKAA